MAWHDFEILFAMVVFAYCITVMISLSLRAAYFNLERLIEEWMRR